MNTRNSSLKWLRRAGGQNLRLKAPAFTRVGGTTEVVPFPETMYETSARSRGHWLPAVEYWTYGWYVPVFVWPSTFQKPLSADLDGDRYGAGQCSAHTSLSS